MQSEPLASVVIPVWRDAPALGQTLNTLPPRPGCEIIVAAVRGDDAAYAQLRASRPDIRWVAASRGRAAQMNAGAAVARAQNLWLVTRFLLGATPAQLARRYHGRHPAAVVLMARAPWTGGKTRVRAAGGESLHAELRQALFRDTLGAVLSVANAEHIVACEPPEAAEQMRGYVNDEIDVVPQRGTGLGDRLAHVFEDTFRLGAESVVVVGSDLPDLPERLLNDAIESLAGDVSRVVVGPAADGGYYLIGMSSPHPSLFDGIAWGTSSVLHQTLDAAANAGIQVRLLEPWRDIDTIEDLERLEHRAAGAAPRTRAWLQRLNDRGQNGPIAANDQRSATQRSSSAKAMSINTPAKMISDG